MTVMQSTIASALEIERTRLLHQAVAIVHSSRETALTADLFSERVRSQSHSELKLDVIEAHLEQMRTNCADAQELATDVRAHIESEFFTWPGAQGCETRLRDARVRLSLADFAYDRACMIDSK